MEVGHSPTPSAARRLLALAVAGLAAATGVALEVTKQNIGPLPLEAAEATSVTVLDRENRLLRAFTTKDGRWRLPLDVSEVDPRYLAMLMAFEDKRF